ncbi:MAG: FkbM family methyltransferase [Candidatus Omnitrophica bacterium]|nr:FkbM family methyltransferase [Candidatus Omnitrophota bacterium]
MREVKENDVIADVGAYGGLYTIALAKRAGRNGKIVVFEPDRNNLALLRENVKLNEIPCEIKIIESVAGDVQGKVRFQMKGSSVSSVSPCACADTAQDEPVESTTLDQVFGDGRLDILKIDVEGFEGRVLLGAKNLLQRKAGFPRAIFIEVHPYAWEKYGTDSRSIVSFLTDAGYKIEDLEGVFVKNITSYGEIIARKNKNI